jgi:hypothetical protein
MRIREGSIVRPRKGYGDRRYHARVIDERPGITRGAVFLDRPLDGFRWWNKRELERVSGRTGGRTALVRREPESGR